MSLLNDVLRDLDRRLPSARAARPNATAGKAKPTRPWLPLAAGLAVAYYVTVEVLGVGQTAAPAAPEIVAANPKLDPKWLAQLPAAQAAVAARAAEASEPVAPVATVSAADELAQRGLLALADGHLLPPGPVNALHLLQTARALAPDHAAANTGLEQMGARLAEQAGAAIATGDLARARELLTVLQREHLAEAAHTDLATRLAAATQVTPVSAALPADNSVPPVAAPPRAPASKTPVAAQAAAPDWRRMLLLAEAGDAAGLESLAARLAPPYAALAHGQAAFLRDDVASARAHLEGLNLSGEAEWLRLRWLASFCWAAADYACARDHYAGASRSPAASGADWLGLAASADQLGRAAEARAAYVRARAAGGHSFEVQRYIDARLAALNEVRR